MSIPTHPFPFPRHSQNEGVGPHEKPDEEESSCEMLHGNALDGDSPAISAMPAISALPAIPNAAFRLKLSSRIHAYVLSFCASLSSWCQQASQASQSIHPFFARLIRILTLSKSAEAQPQPTPNQPTPYQPDPAIQALAAEHMERIAQSAAQAAEQEMVMRTDSLLNASVKCIGPHRDPSSTSARLCQTMSWRQASLTGYAPLVGLDIDPAKQEALTQWEQSYAALHQDGSVAHANACFEALQALPAQEKGSVVRYAGAFGKKQLFIQRLLTNLNDHVAAPLPRFLKHAIEKGAMESPEAFLSHVFDTFINYLLQQDANLTESSELHTILTLLKPLFPDIERHSPKWNSIKAKLPTWLAKKGDDTLQQGLLSCLLDFIPDSHAELRDQCLTLLEQGSQAENHRAVFAQWKPFFMQKALAALPLNSIDDANGDMEESLFAFLQDIPSVANPLAEMIGSHLFSHGTYFQEWSYDHDTHTYSLAIYASGAALAEAHYPRQGNQPIWPICLRGIRLDMAAPHPVISTCLQAMSQTTACTQRWQQPRENFHPLEASHLFGEQGFITLLQSMGAFIDFQNASLLPSSPMGFSQMDMVSRYHAPERDPACVRYEQLRQRLLEAIHPFAHVPAPGQPPHLVLPEGEEGQSQLALFQAAANALQKGAERGYGGIDGLKEIAAFKQQLEMASKAHQAFATPSDSQSTPEASLGFLMDQLLQAFCQSEGQAHLFEDYRELIVFALGEGSEGFVDLLCARAKQVQAEVKPLPPTKATPTKKAASPASLSSPAEYDGPHRERGTLATSFYAMYTLWQVYRYVKVMRDIIAVGKRAVTYGWVALLPDAVRFVAPKIIPQSIQNELYGLYNRLYTKLYTHMMGYLRPYAFKILFPKLQDTKTLRTLHEIVLPYLAALPGAEVPHHLPVPLPEPIQMNITPLTRNVEHIHIAQEPIQAQSLAQALTAKNVESKPFEIGSHLYYQAFKKCEEALTSRLMPGPTGLMLPISQLGKVLLDWHQVFFSYPHPFVRDQACFNQPHLLVHSIHRLPILPASHDFAHTYALSYAEGNEEDIRRALLGLSELGELLSKTMKSVSKAHYQLAQYRLLALMDQLARQLPNHPFGNHLIDADPLLEIWYAQWSPGGEQNIYEESQEQFLTLLSYFYPDVNPFNAPPSRDQRKKWSEQRWFYNADHYRNTAAPHSPEYIYYKEVAQKTQNENLFLITENENKNPLKKYIIKPKTQRGAIEDLFLVAHYPGRFQHPLDERVLLLRAQMLKCRFYLLNAHAPDFNLNSQKIHIDSKHKESLLSKIYSKIYLGLDSLFGSPSSDSRMRMIEKNIHDDKPSCQPFRIPKEHQAFWTQEFEAIGMEHTSSPSDEPLTAPARALRLIAHDPNAIESEYPERVKEQLWNFMFSMGHLARDFQENPALIHDYAQAMHSLFDAAKNATAMLHVFKLTLALRSRAWIADPDTQAFTFLSHAICRIHEHATDSFWTIMALEALYHDHPKPETLSIEEQQHALSLLLSAMDHFKKRKDIKEDVVKEYYPALEQMAIRWYPCMSRHSATTLPLAQPRSAPPVSPEQNIANNLKIFADKYGVQESIPQGATPSSTTWMEVTPLQVVQNEQEYYMQRTAIIYRRIGNTQYTLLKKDAHQYQQLQNVLFKEFYEISARFTDRSKVHYWIQRSEEDPQEGSRSSIMISHNAQTYIFALEYKASGYHLLGMLERDGQILSPASRKQVAQWCAPWAHFCPIASMQLLVNRETGHPVRCHMAPFGLDFAFVKTADGWKGENAELYPGFWIAKEQPMPFGLILENQEGEKQLLLPRNTLIHQTLYAHIDPLFGILSHFVQRQDFLHITHAKGAFHTYRLVKAPHMKDRWVSQDSYAMAHLLLLYFGSNKKEEMMQAGGELLHMQLPANLEMELLPLQLASDTRTQRLHADLLVRMENSLLAPAADENTGWIGQHIPAKGIPLLALISVYQKLASTKSLGLPDTTLHTLFGRFRRLLHANRDQLLSGCKYPQLVGWFSTDWIALQLLPNPMQAHMRSLERGIGNAPSLVDRSISWVRAWHAMPTPAIFTHPLIKPLLTQGIIGSTSNKWNQLQLAMPQDWQSRVVRTLICPKFYSNKPLPTDTFWELSANIQQKLVPTCTPESLSQETIIPYFLTYQAMAQGKFGKWKQTRLLQQLYLQQWTLQGTQQQLSQILVSIAAHPYRYALFNVLRNRKRSLQTPLIQYQKNIPHEKQLEQQKKAKQEGQVQSRNYIGEFFIEIHEKCEDKEAEQIKQTKEELLHQWNMLINFSQNQPKWDAIYSASAAALSVIATFYTLSTLSETVLRSTVSIVSPVVSGVAHADLVPTALPVSLVFGVFMTMLPPSLLNKSSRKMTEKVHALKSLVKVPKSCCSALQIFNRYAPLQISARSMSAMAQIALAFFSIQCMMAYTSSISSYAPVTPPLYETTTIAFSPLHNMTLTVLTNPISSSSIDPRTLITLVAGFLPTLKLLYNVSFLMLLAQKSETPLRTRNIVALPQPSPRIPLSCQQALHAENQRWKEYLDTLFDTHFASHPVEQVPLVMENLQSERVRDSLGLYQEGLAALPRMLFSPRNHKTLHQLGMEIEKRLAELEQFQKKEFHTLLQAFEIPQEEQGLAMEAFRRFFAVGEASALKDYSITLKQREQLQSILPRFFLHETEKQQLQRIVKAFDKLQKYDPETEKAEWEAACEQLITHMRTRRVYDISTLSPERLALFLAFESSTSTLLWKQQVETVSMVLEARGKSIAYELLMSLGKTFFAIPMTALSEADGQSIVFLVWPEEMYATQTRETGEQLSLLSGRPVTPLSIDRTMPLTVERLDALLRLMKLTQHQKGAISTRKHDLQALKLLFIEYLHKLPKGKLTSEQTHVLSKMQKLLATLRKRGVFIGDEAHKLFEDIALHFPLGAKEKMDIHEAHAVRNTVTEMLQGPLGEILYTDISLGMRPDGHALFERERARVARKIVEEGICGEVKEPRRDALIEYLLDSTQKTPSWLKKPQYAKQLKSINSARGVLLNLFPLLFSRKIGGAFCPSKKHPELPYVIPAIGNQTPAESRRIATPHETLVKTLVYYWHHGLSISQFKTLLQVCDAKSQKWAKEKQGRYAEAPDAQAFAALFPENTFPKNTCTLQAAMQLINNPAELFKLLQPVKEIQLLAFYSRCCIEPFLECHPAQCSSNAHDYASMARSNIVCTGTAYNADIYPLEMQRQLNPSTLGEAITHIKNKCKGIISLTQDNPQALLQEVLQTLFLSEAQATALIDGGGLLTGMPHEEVARTMLAEVRKQRPHIEVVDYFDIDPKSGESVCMSLVYGTPEPLKIPMHTCKTALEKRIAYFDESHGFAANIPQPPNGKGVLLVGVGHQLCNGVQNAYRKRKLPNYIEFLGLQQEPAAQQAAQEIHERDLTGTQTLYIALAPQVACTLREREGTPPTLEFIVDYLAYQEEKRMKTVHLQGGLSMLHAKLHQHLMEALLQAQDSSAIQNHFDQSEALFVTPTAQDATSLYGGAHTVASGTEVMQARYTQALDHLRNHPLLSAEQRNAAEEALTHVLNHFMTLPLPEEVPVRVDEKGAYVMDIENVGREVEAEAEAEKEKETEREAQHQHQPPNKVPFKHVEMTLYPWSNTCPLNSAQWQWIDVSALESPSRIKQMISVLNHYLFKIRKARYCSPPLFTLQNALECASEKSLRELSGVMDSRIWWSNHLLPQLNLSFRSSPVQPGTLGQRLISHLLIEIEPEQGSTPAKIISVGCLGTTDASYWIERLQREHHRNREKRELHQGRESHQDRLFMLYQMPTLENLEPKSQYDGTVITFNQDSSWKPQESTDFERLEVMIKFCNGDIRYTEKQRTHLKQWRRECRSLAKHTTLNRAFAVFYTMAKERLNAKDSALWSLDDVIDPYHEEV